MAALVPAITEITARVATYDASGLIDAVRDHINAGDTTHLQIDAYTLNEGLTIGFIDGGEGQQVNLRKNGADALKISIEPSGSITDPGDSTPTAPTGTSADWSSEVNFDVGWNSGAWASGSKTWIVEMADAFFLVLTDTANTYQALMLHAGRIAVSFLSSDAPSNGQDGLGIIGGVPDSIDGSTNDWLQDANAGNATIHWATNEWAGGVAAMYSAQDWVSDAIYTAYRPLPPLVINAYDIGGGAASGEQTYGFMKYIRNLPNTNLPRTLVADTGSNQAWMHFNDTNSVENYGILWDKTVTP